jgi:hypothetical protein
MQFIFLSMMLIGTLAAFIGLKYILRFYRARAIFEAGLHDGEFAFEVEKKKRYGVFIIGGFYLSSAAGYGVRIREKHGQEIPMRTSAFKTRLLFQSRRIMEYQYFEAEPGSYILTQEGSENLHVKRHRHPFFRLFTSPLSKDRLGILIREVISPLQFGLSIVGVVLGLQCLLWGIILWFFPEIFTA